MKHLAHNPVLGSVCIALAAVVLAGNHPALADVKKRTFRNDSAVSANDFHVVRDANGKRFRSASVVHTETGNAAWTERAFAPQEDSFDWNSTPSTSPGGHLIEPIPSGDSATVSSEPGAAGKNSYFTHDGVVLPTKMVATRIRARSAGSGLRLDFSNEDVPGAVLMQGISVTVNNTGDPDDLNFVPDGVPAVGVPSTVLLEENETAFFYIVDVDLALAVHVACDVVDLADPAGIFPTEDVLRPQGEIGFVYCGGEPNSTGARALLYGWGSPFVFESDLWLEAINVPPGSFGYFLTSLTEGFVQPPGSVGFLCLGGNIGRMRAPGQVLVGPVGELWVDLETMPVNPPQPVLPGESWNFQCWYRDGAVSNFSDAIKVDFL